MAHQISVEERSRTRRVKIAAALAVLTLGCVVLVAIAPNDLGRLPLVGHLIGQWQDPLFASNRLEAEFATARDGLDRRALVRVQVYPEYLVVEAQSAGERVELLDIRQGHFRHLNEQSGFATRRRPFAAADLDASRVRTAVREALAMGLPGTVEFVSYETYRAARPLTLTVWLRHEPVSTLVDFDPYTGRLIGTEPVETTPETVLGGCWC